MVHGCNAYFDIDPCVANPLMLQVILLAYNLGPSGIHTGCQEVANLKYKTVLILYLHIKGSRHTIVNRHVACKFLLNKITS